MMAQNGHTFELIRGVNTLDVSDLVTYSVASFDGLGMPPMRRLTQRGPLQDGDSDVGYRLDPRIIRILLMGSGASDAALAGLRAQMVGFLRPGSDAIKLRWTQDDGTVRQIDTHYSGAMSLPSEDWRLATHKINFELRAADPTFYDPVGQSVQFAQTGGGTAMPVPMLFPLTFGASNLNVSETITLAGDNAWLTYPTIIVTGPVAGLVLTNTTIDEVLDFTGFSLGSGDILTIDLRYGAKTVTEDDGTNRIDKLTTGSNLASWRLVPGANSITAVGTGVSSSTAIAIQFNQRYIGV
jgi:hypothetical protein